MSEDASHNAELQINYKLPISEQAKADIAAELVEYRLRCSKYKERMNHLERLNKEHETLYTQFLVKSIKAERDKQKLE